MTRDKGVAILGKVLLYAVTFTFKVTAQRGALVLWWPIPTLSVVSFNVDL